MRHDQPGGGAPVSPSRAATTRWARSATSSPRSHVRQAGGGVAPEDHEQLVVGPSAAEGGEGVGGVGGAPAADLEVGGLEALHVGHRGLDQCQAVRRRG